MSHFYTPWRYRNGIECDIGIKWATARLTINKKAKLFLVTGPPSC